LAGTAVGALAGAALVLAEPGLAGLAVVRNRALGQVAALVRLDDDTARTSERGRDNEHD